MISHEALIIESKLDYDKNEIDRKQLPRIKRLKLLEVLFPFIILLFCVLFFAFNYWFMEYSLVSAIIWSSLPLIGWMIGQLGASIIIRKSEKKIRDHSILFQSNQKWVINKVGINVNANVSDSVLSWDYISKIEVTSHLIVFYLTRRHYFFIPKYILDEKKLDSLLKIIEEILGGSRINFIEDKKKKENSIKNTE